MYEFCRNSPYYEMVVENIKKVENVQKLENACKSFSDNACSNEKLTGEEICKKILYMYKFLNELYHKLDPKSTITNEDLDFLNYWLNVKLKDKSNNTSLCISKFIEAINNLGEDFISKEINLEKHLKVIDRDNLENMELLCELYDTKQKIFDIMLKIDYSNNGKTLCPEYTERCHKRYREGMDKCLNDYDDFYKALKRFKYYYKHGIEKETDTSGYCYNSEYFRLPEYDPIQEKQRNIMAGKILSAPLILSFVIPLLYKYTPFGPFLRAKTKMIKNRWINPDKNESELLLSSTDIEDNISDNGEYNIGYYSGRNY
ncbi:PIR protein [Plasmodium ovale]|uniref:PIR Superfamily Protein n=2 Tax=Plasmodium ovale TaxID=36330 RepID=A0A1A8WE07_PLAOA|nr:PIR Superfamily Protein [Plasmodium ovale curtisi]SBT84237.1 PIR protein [Plasmodium ovale]